MSAPIIDRMEDCGDGRHVGWWIENLLVPKALLVEILPTTITISCCEGERGRDRRMTFVTSRAKAVEITMAMAKALGITLPAPPEIP